MRIEQVEGPVAAERLIVVDEIERQVERMLPALGHAHQRRRAAEVNADVAKALPVDDERSGDIDVGVGEVTELLLPVAGLEFEEERAQRAGVVHRLRRVRLDVRRRDARPWRHRFLARTFTARAAGPARPAAGTTAHASTAPASGTRTRERRARIYPFRRVQPLVAVAVELLHQFQFRRRTAGTAATRSAGALRTGELRGGRAPR